jgi:putative Mg2+ transporter-C (MgtC) family protein
MYPLGLQTLDQVYVLDIALAAFLGALIGYERERRGKRAGLRTFSLICIGSCVFTLLSINAFEGSETARVAAQVVVGIGFLGGAVIWKEGDKLIHGITTSADIWVSAAVGMAIGANQYLIAVATTFFVMIVLNIKTKYDKIN